MWDKSGTFQYHFSAYFRINKVISKKGATRTKYTDFAMTNNPPIAETNLSIIADRLSGFLSF